MTLLILFFIFPYLPFDFSIKFYCKYLFLVFIYYVIYFVLIYHIYFVFVKFITVYFCVIFHFFPILLFYFCYLFSYLIFKNLQSFFVTALGHQVMHFNVIDLHFPVVECCGTFHRLNGERVLISDVPRLLFIHPHVGIILNQ